MAEAERTRDGCQHFRRYCRAVVAWAERDNERQRFGGFAGLPASQQSLRWLYADMEAAAAACYAFQTGGCLCLGLDRLWPGSYVRSVLQPFSLRG